MASAREELERKRQAASGDSARARLNQMRSRARRSTGDVVRGAAGNVVEGLTFGWGDEMLAGAMAPFAAMKTGESIGDAYSGIKAQINRPTEQFREQNPVSAGAAMLGGGLLTGAAAIPKIASAAAARSPMAANAVARFQNMSIPAQAITAGGVGGGIAGAGGSEEGGRLVGAAIGAPVGAVAAPLVPAVANVAGRVARPTLSGIAERMRSPADVAMRKMQEFLPQNKTLAQMQQRVRDLGERGTLAEVSPGMGRLSQGLAAKSGPHQDIMTAARESRQMGQQPTLIRKLEETTGLRGTYYDDLSRMDREMAEIAAPLYQQAMPRPISLDVDIPAGGKLGDLFRRKVTMTAYRKAQDLADIEGTRLPDLFDEDGELIVDQIDTRTADWVKKGLDTLIDAEEKPLGGFTNRGRMLNNLKRDFVSAIDEQNPAYKAAREAWAGPTRISEAARKGRQALRQDSELTVEDLAGMTESEKTAYRNAMVKEIMDRIETSKETGNAAIRADLISPKNRKRMRAAWPEGKAGTEAFDDFYGTLRNEAKMSGQWSEEFRGSQTELRRQAAEALNRPPPPDIGVQPQTGGPTLLGAAGDIMEHIQTPAMNQRTANAMAQMMTTQGVQPNMDLLARLYRYRSPSLMNQLIPAPLQNPAVWSMASGGLLGNIAQGAR